MLQSDQKEILKWNESQRRLIMEFALKTATDYFSEDSIYCGARFDQRFFQPLVAEFNQKFKTQATSRTLAACFCNLKDGYLYYDQKLIEFPGLGWYDMEKAMVINSQTYRSRFERDVKKFPGLKGWVWGGDAFLACPYIDEIESLETMVGDYCDEWLSGEPDESYAFGKDNDYDEYSSLCEYDSDDSVNSDVSRNDDYIWQNLTYHSDYNKKQSLVNKNHQHSPNTVTNLITTISSNHNAKTFMQSINQPGLSSSSSHNLASTNIDEDESSSSLPLFDPEIMITFSTNRDLVADPSHDFEIVGIEPKRTAASGNHISFSRKRAFENSPVDRKDYKRYNNGKSIEGTSKENPIELF